MTRDIIKGMLCFVLFMVFCITSVKAEENKEYYKEELKFDSDGKLLMTTRDLIATTGTTYRTIGWIIKRYDAPMDAPLQQYAIIRLNTSDDIESRVDKDDPAYIYSYYYGDKDEIWNNIREASIEWQEELGKYGGIVYIDELMTVCNNGVARGGFDYDGKLYGEYYYTYEGISNARTWASKKSLKTHFDKSVEFYAFDNHLEYKHSEKKIHTYNYKLEPDINMRIGHNKEGKEEYEVTRAVPSGEKLYISGRCSRYRYNISIDKLRYTAYIPVEVIVTYNIHKKDYNGKPSNRTMTISKWYYVKREIHYFKLSDISLGYLYRVNVSSDVFANDIVVKDLTRPAVEMDRSGGIRINVKSYKVNVDGGDLYSDNYVNPVIPDKNFEADAKSVVGALDFRNDYLRIDNNIILDKKQKVVKKDVLLALNESTDIKKNYVNSNVLASNGRHSGKCSAEYIDCFSKNKKQFDYKTNDVVIHTPVVCNGKFKGDNRYNQLLVCENKNYWVTGCKVNLGISTKAPHIKELGYGDRNYRKYIIRRQIRLPFDVYMDNNLIHKNTWIDISSDREFYLPYTVSEGEYVIEYRCISSNGINKTDRMQNIANIDISNYVAYDSKIIEVIGRIYGMRITDDEDNCYRVGNKDMNGNQMEINNAFPCYVSEGMMLNIFTTVSGQKCESVVGRINYYYMNDARQKAYIYIKEGEEYKRIDSEIVFSKVSDNDSEIREWSCQMTIPDEIYAFSEDIEPTEINDEYVRANRLRGGNIIMNIKLYTVYGSENRLGYIGGACNMWRIEGGKKEWGDSIVIGIKKNYFSDYAVVGTH